MKMNSYIEDFTSHLKDALEIGNNTSFLSASAETRGEYFWMTNPDIGFYTNFFF